MLQKMHQENQEHQEIKTCDKNHCQWMYVSSAANWNIIFVMQLIHSYTIIY